MATQLSISEIIELGRVSTYLAANYVSKGSMFGGTVIKPTPPTLIAMTTDALDWGYTGGAETSASLRSTANYLYWLCGTFQMQAQYIVNGAGGGSVVPTPSFGSFPEPYDWIISSTTSASEPMKDGDQEVVLDGTNGTRDFRNFNVEFDRGGQPQYTTNAGDGSTYFQWNRTTGRFWISSAANLGEPFRIVPVFGVVNGGGGSTGNFYEIE